MYKETQGHTLALLVKVYNGIVTLAQGNGCWMDVRLRGAERTPCLYRVSRSTADKFAPGRGAARQARLPDVGCMENNVALLCRILK